MDVKQMNGNLLSQNATYCDTVTDRDSGYIALVT
jgi:hypothetical protein